jgi:hypothetical protein
MSSGVKNLVAGGVKENKPSAGPTNFKQNVYGRQISTLQDSLFDPDLTSGSKI